MHPVQLRARPGALRRAAVPGVLAQSGEEQAQDGGAAQCPLVGEQRERLPVWPAAAAGRIAALSARSPPGQGAGPVLPEMRRR